MTLRKPQATDAQTIFEGYAQDPEVTRYVAWPPHRSVNETELFVGSAIEAWESGRGHRPWVLERPADEALLGMIGVSVARHRVGVGYVLARPYWNMGYATEALEAVTRAAMADPTMFRVWALCDVDNLASARVMEKAGLRFEGVNRGYGVHPNVSEKPRDVRCYAIIRGDV
jgi:RimJ/RimL family protein N-acetyltransferase